MDERQLAAIISDQVDQSIGKPGGQLAIERAMEIDYYNGQPLGNEKAGESQVVSTDVFDAVEGMLPALLKTFTASDDAVVFEPVGPGDDEISQQITDTCNYVFYKQNNGFLVFYEWFKDALINKNGVVKYWWEKKITTRKESYAALSEIQYRQFVDNENTKILAHSAFDDPQAVEARTEMLDKIRGGGAQLPPNINPQQIISQIEAQPVPQLHDITVEVTRDESKVCINVVPPEEFGISARHPCVSIQDTPFCYQKTRMTISQLRELGCPDDVIEQIGSGDSNVNLSPINLARDRFTDERQLGLDPPDDSMREVWVTECFIRVDYDDDGISELRRVVMPENAIWINEEADHINFAAITPIIMPHRWTGRSIAEIVMDIQYTSSVLWRQMLNNLYLTNNPRKAVLANAGGGVQANLDDLLNSRPGGIVREYMPNAVRDMEVPFVAGASFPMLEYMQGLKESRTGITRYNQGLDADSLNKTAHGISLIQSAAQQRIDLIARIFAETGVKDLMRGIAYMLTKYSSRKMAIKLRGKWVDVDPREWADQFNMTTNVGLGTGNKDAQLMHLLKMNDVQMQLMKEGRGYMVTDENVWNLGKRMSQNMGFKHPEEFITDPATVQKPPPAPDPAMAKVEADAKTDAAKMQQNAQIRQFDAQTQEKLAQIQAQTQIAIAQINDQTKREIAGMRAQQDQQNMTVKSADDATMKASELQLREINVSYQEQLLSLKKQMDAMQESHAAEAMQVADTRQADVANGIVSAMQQSLSEIANAMTASNEKILAAILAGQSSSVQQTTAVITAIMAPKSVRLGNVQKDSAGNVVGADSHVTSTLQ